MRPKRLARSAGVVMSAMAAKTTDCSPAVMPSTTLASRSTEDRPTDAEDDPADRAAGQTDDEDRLATDTVRERAQDRAGEQRTSGVHRCQDPDPQRDLSGVARRPSDDEGKHREHQRQSQRGQEPDREQDRRARGSGGVFGVPWFKAPCASPQRGCGLTVVTITL